MHDRQDARPNKAVAEVQYLGCRVRIESSPDALYSVNARKSNPISDGVGLFKGASGRAVVRPQANT